MNKISPKAIIGNNVVFGNNIIIGDDVEIGDNSTIGHNTIIERSKIGAGAKIESNCNLGYGYITPFQGRPDAGVEYSYDRLLIDQNVLIREGCTLYLGSQIARNVRIHHKALIRENQLLVKDHLLVQWLSWKAKWKSVGFLPFTHEHLSAWAQPLEITYLLLR